MQTNTHTHTEDRAANRLKSINPITTRVCCSQLSYGLTLATALHLHRTVTTPSLLPTTRRRFWGKKEEVVIAFMRWLISIFGSASTSRLSWKQIKFGKKKRRISSWWWWEVACCLIITVERHKDSGNWRSQPSDRLRSSSYSVFASRSRCSYYWAAAPL